MTPASPPLDQTGAPAGTSSLEHEVARLSARVAALEEENAALQGFAAVAAHELVVPLVAAEAYASMVRDRLTGEAEADSRRDLDTLARGAARARLLLEGLLQDARTRGHGIIRQPVDMSRLVRDCVALVEPEINARGARVDVGKLPEVLGEECLLSSVWTNLIFNAIKYSPREGGTVRIYAVRELAQWRFFVSSDGPAIPREDRERIFEPFHRARTERRENGAGLGLTICRSIIERHGGTIGVTTANGSGNAFFFTLPTR
jgi:signal transduction histidine kinase